MSCSNESNSFTISKSNQACVADFHRMFCHPCYSDPQPHQLGNEKLTKLRYNLILEEFTELKAGIAESNRKEIIDGVADMLYVVLGAGNVFGIDLTGHVPVDSLVKTFPTTKTISSSVLVAQFQTLLDMLRLFFNTIHFDSCAYVLQSMIQVLYLFSIHFSFDLDRAFAIVHESNMKKACATEAIAQATVKHYKTKKGFETANVGYKRSGCGTQYVMYNVDTGKGLKSMYFQDPDFSEFL